MNGPRSLWILEPWETLDHPRDTSLRLIEESMRLGRHCAVCDFTDLRFEGARVIATSAEVSSIREGRFADGWSFQPATDRSVLEFDLVHYRVDPPVDARYLEPLRILSLATRPDGRPLEVTNPIRVLMRVSEKLGTPAIAKLLPPTVVSAKESTLRDFALGERRVVMKPMSDAQSRAVKLLDWSSPAAIRVSLEMIAHSTRGFTTPVVLQRFLPEIYVGERRFWFVDGELLATVVKLPPDGTFVVDMDAGSKCIASVPTEVELALGGRIGGFLRESGVRLAAVDAIGGFVTDVNVTSPGMIPVMEDTLGTNLARLIVESL